MNTAREDDSVEIVRQIELLIWVHPGYLYTTGHFGKHIAALNNPR